MMTTTHILIYIGAAALAYAYVSNRLIALMHPARMEMADLGAQLLASDELSAELKARIQSSLDDAYSAWHSWAYAALLPVVILRVTYKRMIGRPTAGHACPAHLRGQFDRFMHLSFWSVVCSSPIGAILVLVQLAVYLLLAFPIGVIVRECAKTAATLDARAAQLHRSVSGSLS